MDEDRGAGIENEIPDPLREAAGKVTGDTMTPREGATEKAQTAVGGAEGRARDNGLADPSADAASVTKPVGLTALPDGKARVAEEQVIPLHTEEVAVSRRKVDRAVVRVATVTHERPALIDEQLIHERVEVERVAVNRMIDAVPPVREEGDTTIIPVVEEIVVVERRLLLKEEVRFKKVRVTEQYRETIVLRDQDVVVTRTEPSDGQGRPMTSPGTL